MLPPDKAVRFRHFFLWRGRQKIRSGELAKICHGTIALEVIQAPCAELDDNPHEYWPFVSYPPLLIDHVGCGPASRVDAIFSARRQKSSFFPSLAGIPV